MLFHSAVFLGQNWYLFNAVLKTKRISAKDRGISRLNSKEIFDERLSV